MTKDMSKTFIFPGQGSQKISMGKELADNFKTAKNVFDEVDDALNQKLSDIIWGDDPLPLNLTENTQPALMATSIAVYNVLTIDGGYNIGDIKYMAGHSLGEYSALCAAGVFNISDTAKLLKTRGQAMQSACPVGKGGMVAIIGLDIPQIEQLCIKASEYGACEVANDNCPGQVVISGDAKAMQQAVDIAKSMGAKRALPLPVSAPFHSSLIKPAADKMAEALSNTHADTPKKPIIANITANEVTDSETIKDLLVQQVTGRVRWTESVNYMLDNNCSQFIELGAGKVLSGLVKRINREATTNALETPTEIEEFLRG